MLKKARFISIGSLWLTMLKSHGTEVPKGNDKKKPSSIAELVKQKPKPENYKIADKSSKEYDEQLIEKVDRINEIFKEYEDMIRPECPECRQNNTIAAGYRKSYTQGTRHVYRCLNIECPRQTFVINDSRIRNLAVREKAYAMLVHGGRDMAPQALRFVRDYGINPRNMAIYEYLKEQERKKNAS